ncbi:MAG: hypothetical protein EOP45_22425, partial [Sphingobacteriaceae bacterium]
MLQNNRGVSNTAVGTRSLSTNTSGVNNSSLGYGALNKNITGSQNTGLGMYADVTAGNLINATAIGYNAKVNASNKVRIGNASVVGTGWNIADNIAIFCLNTALYSSGGFENIDDKGKLCIDTRVLYNWVQHNEAKTKILVMHHPIEWLKDWSQIELLKIIKSEFCLCLSGHIHDQSYFHSINKEREFVNCSAPPLLTNKNDNLGYSLITVSSDGVKDIYYRQWTKNNSFVTGVSFSDSDDGKVIIGRIADVGVPEDKKKADSSSLEENFVDRYLSDRFKESLKSFSTQPMVWVEPVVSKTNDVGRGADKNKENIVPVCELLDVPASIFI